MGAETVGVDGAETMPPRGADTIGVEGADTTLLRGADWLKFCRGSLRCGRSIVTGGAETAGCGFADRACSRKSERVGVGEC